MNIRDIQQNPTLIRRTIQIVFLIILIAIGIKFYLFVSQIEKGMVPNFERPPGVEAFLPISALVSLKHFLYTGEINDVHPSALVIFLIICASALLLKKGFCSWICPIGLLSEFLSKLHLKLFKKRLSLPLWTDIPLRSLKYLLAGFFIYQIFYKMSPASIEQFIYSPYHKFADIKMLYLFTKISTTSLIVITVLFLLSVIIPNFWCRYLCPYGAVLGVISFFSSGRIKRNPTYCTNCGKCEHNCPGLIRIRDDKAVFSSECTACLTCVSVCPEKHAIGFKLFHSQSSLSPVIIGIIFILLFVSGIATAKISGNWQNSIPIYAYFEFVRQKNTISIYEHPDIDSETVRKMMDAMKAMRDKQAENPDIDSETVKKMMDAMKTMRDKQAENKEKNGKNGKNDKLH
jgi:polyferredoxin